MSRPERTGELVPKAAAPQPSRDRLEQLVRRDLIALRYLIRAEKHSNKPKVVRRVDAQDVVAAPRRMEHDKRLLVDEHGAGRVHDDSYVAFVVAYQ